ncbi:MAG: alpha/beta fold hydrolase [Clostridia bacterium]|nr:alpha/beta fold hydrolase [Clostridia bacterium]
MHSSQFFIPDDGIRLNAKLDKPEGSDRLVIVIHGFTGHMEETHITAVSRAFNDLGYATLRVDMYGHGHSDGAFRDHTLFKWMTNALTVIDYARGLEFAKEIYLCGHSQGGLLVMLAAGMRRELIRGLIPLSPAAMIPEICRRGEMLGIPFDPDNIPEELAFDDKTLGGNYLRVAQTIRVEDAIDRYDGPVLIVHGDDDESVPVQVGIDAANRYKNGTLALIPGDDHCYNRHLDQVVGAVKAWMSAHF